jgi:mRNA interferase HigB
MHVITRKRLNEFVKQHPESKAALTQWYKRVKAKNYVNLNELHQDFPAADLVEELTVFNIGGNNYRLIAAIHYNRHKLYIRAILTHSEYDKGDWKE